jgi:methylenetetrahydrofolate reductase (NADPH)
MDMSALRRYMERLVGAKVTWQYAVIVTMTPLPSAETGRWLAENSRRSLIPGALIKRMEAARDPEQEGVDICAELMREAATIPGVAGINLLTLGNPPAVLAALDASRLSSRPAGESRN